MSLPGAGERRLALDHTAESHGTGRPILSRLTFSTEPSRAESIRIPIPVASIANRSRVPALFQSHQNSVTSVA
ncbi:MAG: hypothetical protein AAGJ31_15665, partial [Verrucomicrobiota bacterium]